MLFNSFRFIIFLIIVYTTYRVLSHRQQNRMLLLASYIFYGSWNWRFLSLIFVSTLVDYLCGLGIYRCVTRQKKRWIVTLSLVVNLGLLGFFKYFNFFAENLQVMFTMIGWKPDMFTLNVILPVGISFYTFQSLSYTIDVYRGEIDPERDFLDFALFVSYFPQLVAGPIERAKKLLPQLKNPRTIAWDDIKKGLWLIFFGFFMKIFIADNLAKIADQVFMASEIMPGGEAVMGAFAFAFQIFGDFAGYSSIAIGVSKLLGIDLMTNFLFPYFVTNPRDFWKNWHVSLSTWLKDYLYIPMGGNRASPVKTYRNLFITMLLGGLWHGASWTFVLWGIFHGGILILHRLLYPVIPAVPMGRMGSNLWHLLKVIFMFQVTCIGWLIFRAQSIAQLGTLLHSMFFNIGELSWRAVYYFFQIIFFTWLLILIQIIQKRRNSETALLDLPGRKKWPIFLAMFYSLVVWGEYGAKEFIYFQF